ncbi:MAG: hypothetical protein ACREM9_02925, partial [Gemmatimonadales bacterium]
CRAAARSPSSRLPSIPARSSSVPSASTRGWRAVPGRRFFVTASHCSDIQGRNRQTDYYNPLPRSGQPNANRIGREFKDPRYGGAGGNCVFYPGFRCRFSDALLARNINPDVSDFGTIARTTFARQRVGSLRIDDDNPRWTVVGEFGFPFLNEIAHKVGRTSGHTFFVFSAMEQIELELGPLNTSDFEPLASQ